MHFGNVSIGGALNVAVYKVERGENIGTHVYFYLHEKSHFTNLGLAGEHAYHL